MKCFLPLVICFLLSLNGFAQSVEEDYILEDLQLAPNLSKTPNSQLPQSFNSKGTNIVSYIYGLGYGESHELRVDHFFHENWSLVYSARYEGPSAYIPNPSSETQFNAPVGLSLGVVMAAGIGAGTCGGYYNNGSLDLIAAAAMIPDGIAYHYYISDELDFSPYVVVSGLSFIQTENKSSVFYSPSCGGRLMYSPSKLFLISAECRMQYSTITSLRTNAGIGVSVRF